MKGIPKPSLYQPLDQITFAVIDVETTGLKPGLGHRLCELAIVRGKLGQEPEMFSQRVNPERPVDPDARRVHNIPDEALRQSPRFAEIAPTVRDLLEGTVIVAHNAPFDLGFLAAEWRRLRWPPPSAHAIDTLSLARRWLRLRRNSLEHVARSLGVPIHHAHSALGDAQATWSVLKAMVSRLGWGGVRTLGDLISAQGGTIRWPEATWEHLPTPLREALETHRPLWLRYVNAQGALSERYVEPLDAYDGYLIAYCHLRREQRAFRLDRIMEMRLEGNVP
ncbi:MAG: WYL domain-containing protein [Anaerolineae bacterium]|nr:WYL domain-containing protein [Anaerolineae bacterium]